MTQKMIPLESLLLVAVLLAALAPAARAQVCNTVSDCAAAVPSNGTGGLACDKISHSCTTHCSSSQPCNGGCCDSVTSTCVVGTANNRCGSGGICSNCSATGQSCVSAQCAQALLPSSITAIDAGTGIVSAKVNASGAAYQFRVTDANLLAGLHVGQGVYASITTMQVSLDGKTMCCVIVSTPQPPAGASVAKSAPGAVGPIRNQVTPLKQPATVSGAAAPASAAQAPAISPAGGTYTVGQMASGVRISDATTGALIHYTTDGSTPTTSSTKYSGPIGVVGSEPVPVSSTITIKTMATASGMTNSTITTATYTILPQSCPSGSSICGNRCAELSGDAKNCGACSQNCATTQICSAGRCVAASSRCPAGQALCNRSCFNLMNDFYHCGISNGTCGNQCALNQTCSNGACKATSAAGDASGPDSVSVALGPAQEVGLGAAPLRGSRDAAVLVIEFADYQCPFCQQMEPRLRKLQAEFGNNVALAFKDFPLSIHPYAEKAAEAARCAGEQGRFWDFSNVLFNSSNLEIDQLKQYARLLALDATAFDRCLDSGKELDGVQADLAQGRVLGIDGTPSFFINGRPFSGAMDYDTLRQIVEREVRAAMPPAPISAAASR